MPSPRYTQQTTWYIDPQNSSGLANDNNSGLTNLLPLLTLKEYHRRVGNTVLVDAGVAYRIHMLSNGNEDDPLDLEVILADDTAFLEVSGEVEAGTETTVANFNAADSATNTLPDVEMTANIFAAADENTRLVYYPDSAGWSPVAVDGTDPARLLMSSILTANTVGTVAQGDTIRRVLPKNIWIAKLVRLGQSALATRQNVRAVGFNIQNQTKIQNAMLLGCLLNGSEGLLSTDLRGCKSACAARTDSQGGCRWIGCFLDGREQVTQLGPSDEISATALSLLRGDVLAAPGAETVLRGAMSDGCTLTCGRAGAIFFSNPLALFGVEIILALLDGAIARRSTLNWDNSGSGTPVVSWPNAIGNVYNATSLVPPGPAANPATEDWAGYGVANWIDQLSGARLNAGLSLTESNEKSILSLSPS